MRGVGFGVVDWVGERVLIRVRADVKEKLC